MVLVYQEMQRIVHPLFIFLAAGNYGTTSLLLYYYIDDVIHMNLLKDTKAARKKNHTCRTKPTSEHAQMSISLLLVVDVILGDFAPYYILFR